MQRKKKEAEKKRRQHERRIISTTWEGMFSTWIRDVQSKTWKKKKKKKKKELSAEGKEKIQIFEEMKKSPVSLNAVSAGKSWVKRKIHRPGVSQVLGCKQGKAAMAILNRKEIIVI